MIRSRPVTGRIVLFHKPPHGHSPLNRDGKRSCSNQSNKCARRESEPRMLGASISLNHKTALDIVNLYRTRVRTEQSFRVLKSHPLGFSFEDSQTQTAARLQILVLIHVLALLVLWIAGIIADQNHLRPAFESNGRRIRSTISIITLGWLALTEHAVRLRYDDFVNALLLPPPLPHFPSDLHGEKSQI